MTTSLLFVLDAQTKAELPDLASTLPAFTADLAVPASGDTVSIASLEPHAFVVKERVFAYDQSGNVVVTCHLTLASERSV